ncbi:MAG: polyphenol oxidase family protein [Desulfovibrionaceae bacterium]
MTSPIAFFPFSFPGLPGVGCAFTSRQGGASVYPFQYANLSHDVGDDRAAVDENRTLLKERFRLLELADRTQVHADALCFDPREGDAGEADGLATARPGVGLMIKTADCQPVLLAHESGRYVAALHVGWRGNVLGFPGSGVARFCGEYGLAPEELFAVRGPSLGPEQAEFTNFEAEFGPGFAAYHDPAKRTVDLWALTRAQLLEAGLLPGRVFGVDLCTRTLPEVFFSYRASRRTGRQAGLIWIVDR